MILGGICGLSIGYVTVLQVQVSLVHNKNNKNQYIIIIVEFKDYVVDRS